MAESTTNDPSGFKKYQDDRRKIRLESEKRVLALREAKEKERLESEKRLLALKETREEKRVEDEDSLRKLRKEEIQQRIFVKHATVFGGFGVVVLMVVILLYMLFCMLQMPNFKEFPWVLILIPATSITVITTAMLIGAFHRFGETDFSKIGSNISMTSGFTGGT